MEKKLLNTSYNVCCEEEAIAEEVVGIVVERVMMTVGGFVLENAEVLSGKSSAFITSILAKLLDNLLSRQFEIDTFKSSIRGIIDCKKL